MDSYRIAINKMALTGKIPAGDPRWAAFNDSFVNQELEPVDILDAIYNGRAYAPWFGGRRKQDTFICAQHIAVDLDTQDQRSAIPTVQRNHFFRLYGTIIHETPSHTDQAPKCRVIFLLDRPIKSATGYRTAIETVYNFFEGADVSCVDPARFFYGNATLQQRPDGLVYVDHVLPLDVLRAYAKQMLLQQKKAVQEDQRQFRSRTRAEAGNAYAQAAFEQELHQLAHTPAGNRNNQLNRSAFSLGQLVAGGLLDETQVASHLQQEARHIGLGETEAVKTLYSGLRAGKQCPRELH